MRASQINALCVLLGYAVARCACGGRKRSSASTPLELGARLPFSQTANAPLSTDRSSHAHCANAHPDERLRSPEAAFSEKEIVDLTFGSGLSICGIACLFPCGPSPATTTPPKPPPRASTTFSATVRTPARSRLFRRPVSSVFDPHGCGRIHHQDCPLGSVRISFGGERSDICEH